MDKPEVNRFHNLFTVTFCIEPEMFAGVVLNLDEAEHLSTMLQSALMDWHYEMNPTDALDEGGRF